MAAAVPQRQHVRGRYWLILLAGTALALGAAFLAPLSYLLRLLVAFIHEIGHSIAGWLFGYPSIPTINPLYGGGVTIQWGRQWWLCLLVGAGIIFLAWRFRRNRLAVAVLASLLLLYMLLSLSNGQAITVLASGHLAELLFAGYLLYRVFQGQGLPRSLERAFLAAFILVEDVRFSWLLVTDTGARQDYEGTNVIGFKMDFTRMASEYLGIGVGVIALSFLICCLLTPPLAWLVFRYRAVAIDPLLARLSRR